MKFHNNLIDVLRTQTTITNGIRFIESDDKELYLSYQEVYSQAMQLLAGLQAHGIKAGDELVLQLNDNKTFILIFWACLLGKIIPVPLAVGNNDEHRLKIFKVWKFLQHPYLISDDNVLGKLRIFAVERQLETIFGEIEKNYILFTEITKSSKTAIPENPAPSDIAFIQFSSGSTGDPKGVMLTHQNLITNLQGVKDYFDEYLNYNQQDDVFLSWMPLTHDMGIIGFHLQPLYLGVQQNLIPTQTFIRRPSLWLKKASQYKATEIGSPNFGYRHFLKLFKPELAKNWDLSKIKRVINGAEPISYQLCAEFMQTLAPYGLHPQAMFPGYGLAEASLVVTYTNYHNNVIVHHVDRSSVSMGQKVKFTEPDAKHSASFVDVGAPINYVDVTIRNETGQILPDGYVGLIYIKGDNVTQGFYHNPTATAKVRMEDGWINTGDLGFIVDNERFQQVLELQHSWRSKRLVITGRAKDIIFINGANYYPHDIERLCEEVETIDLNKIACCGVRDAQSEQDEILLFVIFKGHISDFKVLAKKLKLHILQKMGIAVSHCIPINKIPKTTSGKVQRYQLAQQYQQGQFDEILGQLEPIRQNIKNFEQNANLLKQLQTVASEILGIAVDNDKPLMEQGFSSIQLVELQKRLSDVLATDLPVSIVFDYPTLTAMSQFLETQLSDKQVHLTNIIATSAPSHEEIAIIGMGCRFPDGIDTPEKFWQLLLSGQETVREIPITRWQTSQFYDTHLDTPGKIYTRYGSFLDQVDGFDNDFFGIMPKEAQALDPQQRILLEVCWEALENAGFAPFSLKNSQTGVFIGISNNDYMQAQTRSGKPETIDAYSLTGNLFSTAAGRISYILGFNGPNIALDTACSSSLVAIHLAIQSLRSGESHLALAGGVNLILSPESYIGLCQMHALSPDGRCKTFSEKADGYGRGEGCGVVVLKRLSDAQRDNDTILAVLKGSAINHDGASNGLTVPNGLAQQNLIRQALKNAQVQPQQLDYIEAHGTGTLLGDPIEVLSLQEIFKSREQKLLIGSVKTNIGHLESAAGIAGLIKTVLAIKHAVIPRSLHAAELNSRIPWQKLDIAVADQQISWTSQERQRIAGISSFGFSGTNAHLIVAAPPQQTVSSSQVSRKFELLTLSAKNDVALHELANKYIQYLDSTQEILADICYTANQGRTHFAKRFAVVAETKESLQSGLKACMVRDVPRGDKKLAFLFTGQGSQYHDMARELYETQAVFKQAMDECDSLLKPILHLSLLDVIYAHQADIHQTQFTQPAIFAVEYALANLWMSWGIQPAALLGHSIGEYVAACLGGMISLEDALQLVAIRGKLLQSLPEGGGMASIAASADVVLPLLQAYPQIAIAAYNSQNSVVISGVQSALQNILAQLPKTIRTRQLEVSHAFHSPLVEPILAEFQHAAEQVFYTKAHIPVVSNVTGQLLQQCDAEYWTQHIRQPVHFQAGLQTLRDMGIQHFIEIGATAALSSLGAAALPECTFLPSLRKNKADSQQLQETLAEVYLHGFPVDWSAFYQHESRKKVSLPTYAFQRKRFWIDLPLTVSHSAHSSQPTEGHVVMQPIENQRNQLIHTIKANLKQVAGLDPETIDLHQNFFELGLDSLALVQLQRGLEKQFDIELEMSQFYEQADTVSKLADYLSQRVVQPVESSTNSAQSMSVTTPASKVMTAQPIVSQTVVTPAAISISADSGNALERLMSQQLSTISQLMTQQLETFKQLGNNTTQTVPIAPISLPSVVQPSVATQPIEIKEESTDKPNVVVPGLYRAVRTERNERFTETHNTHVKNLATNYNQRTHSSKEYAARHRPVFANNRNIIGFRPEWKEMIYPIVVERGEGSKIWDVDGNQYVDITMGFGVVLFGHNPAFIRDAMAEELQNHGSILGPMSRVAGDVATLIHEITGMERVAFFNTGSEAVMVAVRLARAVTGRDKIVIFTGAYHGFFDGVLAAGWAVDGKPVSFPIAPGTPANLVKDVIVLKYGDPESLDIIKQLGTQVAAVLVEPVQSRNPTIQPREFLHELRNITQQNATALIFDEMILGFRMHPRGGQGWFGIEADLATYGKVLGGGMPIGVVAGKAKFMEMVDGGLWQYGDASTPAQRTAFIAGTFSNHPMTMAAAKAVLTEIKRQSPQLQQDLNHKTEAFCQQLNQWFTAEEVPIQMHHFGSLFRFNYQGDTEILNYHLLNQGVYVWEERNCFLSVAHTAEDIEFIINAVKQGVAEMRQGGWLPPSPQKKTRLNTSVDSEKKAVQSTSSLLPGHIPLSVGQKEMWFLTHADPTASLAYNEVVLLEFNGNLQLDLLHQAINQVVARHEALRVTRIDGEMQHIASQLTLELPFINFSQEPDKVARQTQIESWFDIQLKQSFDLQQDKLIRCYALQLETQRYQLLIIAAHIITDGWSLGVLVHEIAAIYSTQQRDIAISLPPVIPYRDFVHWEVERVTDPKIQAKLEKSQQYWQTQFANFLPVLELPSDRPRPALQSYQGRRLQRVLSNQLYQQLKSFSRQQGVSIFATLLTSFNTLLARLTQQHEFLLGMPIAGHSLMGAMHLIGQCTAMLPMPIRLTQNTTFSELLTATKRQVLDMQAHQDAIFHRAVSLAIPPVTVIFNLDKAVSLQFSDLQVKLQPSPIHHVKFDLFLNALEAEGELVLDLDYRTDLFDTTRAKQWIENYLQLLQSVIENPQQKILPISPTLDSVLRVQGYRVNIHEIQQIIRQYAEIQDVVVLANHSTGQHYDAKLTAYLVVNNTFSVKNLRQWLKIQLPSYQIPSYFIRVTSIPYTDLGEVDQIALQTLNLPRETGVDYLAPRDELESQLIDLWQQILAMQPIGIDDNFFELGGQSLKAVQLLAKIQQEFGIQLNLKEIFEAPTVATLANVVRQKTPVEFQTISKVSESKDYSLSNAQKRLWLLEQMEENLTAYNIPVALRHFGELDVAKFQQVLQQLSQRHETLRTIFIQRDGEPRQKILAEVSFPIESHDLSQIENYEVQLNEVIQEITRHTFNLTQAPLLRVVVCRLPEYHVIIFNIHHIISDGWSMGVFIEELFELYHDNPLIPLEIQYKDYSAWQHNLLESTEVQQHQNYWKNKLASPLTTLELLTDLPRPAVKTFNGAHHKLTLDKIVTSGLRALSVQYQSSVFISLMTIIKILLHRYTGQEDIIVGTVTAGRNHPWLAQQLGFFVNSLVLRDNMTAHESFTTLLPKVKQTMLDAVAHEIYPFDRLVEELAQGRDLSHNPLFDVMIAMDDRADIAPLLKKFNLQEIPLGTDDGQFDLTFSITEQSETIDILVAYNTDLYLSDTIERMSQHLYTLLNDVVARPQCPISQLQLLTEAEIQAIIQFYQPISLVQSGLHHLVEWQVELTPDAIAIQFENQSFTYAEVEDQANQLANYLLSLGVQLGDFIGLSIERSPLVPISLLAILKAGGVYLPLDPAYPQDRIAYMLEDTQAKILLTQQDINLSPLSSQVKVVYLDNDFAKIAACSPQRPNITISPNNLAYVIYTSGSTGQPKGVMISHQSIAQHYQDIQHLYQLNIHDKVLQFASISFDTSLEQLLPLTQGGCLVLRGKELWSSVEFVEKLLDYQITVADIPPEYWRALAQEFEIIGINSELLTALKLRLVIVGGEVMSVEDLRQWRHTALNDVKLLNVYGPTEATIEATVFDIPADYHLNLHLTKISIGKPLASRRIYILDKQNQIVPTGVAGELVISGCLAEGYLNNPGLTAEKFIECEFNLAGHKIVEKIYKTGDLARYLTDGNIEFLGRIDNQVKLRGFRIELGEIETALNQHAEVRESVVMLREDQPRIKYLAAYLRLKSEMMATNEMEAELRNFLKQRLPEYMIPTAFVFLDYFPLTGSGKIDRRALPAPNLQKINKNLVTPRTPLEQQLVILWAEVLKLPQVGIFDNFFDLGGHSLTANQVVSKIHKTLAKKLTLKEFFTHPTVAEIAGLLEKRGRSDLPPIQPVTLQPHYPLSYAQRRLWTATQMTGDSAAYNMVGGFILSGNLNVAAFKQCFNLLIARHESLRTRFIMVAGEPRQEILPTLAFEVVEADISHQAEEAAQSQFYQELQSTFDLRQVPLLRVKLLKLPSDSTPRYLCIVNMHHIIGDGVSVEVLFKEIISLYRDMTENRPNSLQPLRVHYKDYVFWQAVLLESEEGQQHKNYWLQQFSDELPVLDLPTDFPRPAVQTQHGDMIKFFLNAELTQTLRELNKQQGVSMFMMVVSLVNTMLYLYTQQEDIVVGSPVAGHNHPDLEQQIGFYVNTLALRTRFSGSDNFVDLLAKVKQVATDAYAHQDYPFDKLVEELNLQRDLSRTPLFDVMVILQNYDPVSFDLPNISVQSFMDDASVTSKFDLNLMFEEIGQQIGVWVEYNTDLFKRTTIELFAENFVKLVRAIIVKPNTQLNDFKNLFVTKHEQQEQSQFLAAIEAISDDF